MVVVPPQHAKRYYTDVDSGYWDNYYARYAVVAAIFIGIVLLVVMAHIHAQRRIKKGLQPLAYHRWLVRRKANTHPYGHHGVPQNTYAYYQPNAYHPPPGHEGQAYPLNGYGPPPHQQPQAWAPPPPAYGQHTWDTPPTYAPPAGASKAAPDQNITDAGVRGENGEGSSSLPAPAQVHQGSSRNDHVITQ